MLDEMSTYDNKAPARASDDAAGDARLGAIRDAVSEVLAVETETFFSDRNITATFTGRLLMNSEQAYSQLDARLKPLDHLAIFREEQSAHVVQVVSGRFDPAPRPWWPNALLFVLTVLSLLYTGAGIALGEAVLEDPNLQVAEMWRGWPYALAIVLILGAHELGHYFAARSHGVPVTLPYFIPFPFGFFGTLGAFIQLRAPMRNRKQLLDIGAAGPLAGMVFAVPILLIGLATATVSQLPVDQPFILEGNSVLYALSKVLVFGRFLPDGRVDVFMNQLAQAGWTGLFVTGLNLIPVGQLDGGHVIYTLFGERARVLYLPAMIIMALLAVAVSEAWFLWVFLLMMFGRRYATPLDAITPLDRRRRVVAIVALVIFVLVFVPNPLQLVDPVSLPQLELF